MLPSGQSSTTANDPLRRAAFYQPHGAAFNLLHNHDPEVLISGPAGTGKSVAAMMKIHLICNEVPGVRAAFVRRVRASLTESALVSFESFVLPEGHAARKGSSRSSRNVYHYPNGSEISLGGLDKATKIMSTEYDLIYVQEAIELTEDLWEALGTRLRHNVLPYQQLLADTNPDKPKHWLKLRCNNGLTTILESRHEDNPLLWDRELNRWTSFASKPDGTGYMDRLDRLTGHRKQRLRFGKWVQAEGAVYEEWDAAIHVIDGFRIPAEWPRYWAIDFGYTDPFVCQWWAKDGEGRLHLYRELVQTHLLVEDAAKIILRLSRDEPRPCAIVCDHDREGRETLARHLDLETDPAIKDMEVGIQAVSLRLRPVQDGKPRLLVHRNALASRDERMMDAKTPIGLIEEIEGYIWDMKDGRVKGEQPLDRDNHSCDAARYLVEWIDEPTADLTLGIFDLSPKKEEIMAYAPRFPQIRYFGQSAQWQPQPIIRGWTVPSIRTFPTQEEAAFFVLEIHRQLKLPAPAFRVADLEDIPGLEPAKLEERARVRKEISDEVKKTILVHNLQPEKEEAVLPPSPEPAQAGGRRR